MLFPISTLARTDVQAETPNIDGSKQLDSFTPTIQKPAWIDQDNNRIADGLDNEIADNQLNGKGQDYVNITVLLKSLPSIQDATAFVSSGGYLTTPPWTEATYGFGGMITYEGIIVFTEKCPNVLLVNKEAIGKVTLAYATQQIGARPYVWSTMGLQGDQTASTAIIDTGIDGSHVNFLSGYGDQDFSKKIVGWKDLVNSTLLPFDDNGHGSHVAGLAAGEGFFSVDQSGYATSTWGVGLTVPSGYQSHSWSGMMVNNTGTITLSVKWRSTGSTRLATFSLYKSGKDLYSWTQVSSQITHRGNNWYSLTFNVTSVPSDGYDIYNPRVDIIGGTGSIYIVLNASWPYMPPSDGFSAWTGVAPQSKLVGVRILDSTGSGSSTDLVSGIDWIIENRDKYHITAASMSLSFESEAPDADLAVLNLVNSGVSVTISSGNSGVGDNFIFSSGSVDEAITVAAMNQFDSITSYSSQGGKSKYTGYTTKPDIAAPGGSHYAVPLFSTDSNFNDNAGVFYDVQTNDSAPMIGTSMAAPIVSGCAQVVIQAMGGYDSWNWTRNQALHPKMLLLMTATETYPNLRETELSNASPTLDRGGKDVHEGYGRVNLDGAVEAVLKSYSIGTMATDALGRPPIPEDISVLGQKLVWARNVQLTSGSEYNFSLSVPEGADFDLYLYNSTGNSYGEPIIVAKSINATEGGIEEFLFTAPYTGTYYLVVKRATATTGSGVFTLSSQSAGTAYVTLNTPGLSNASNVVHYIQNGVAKTGNIEASAFSDFVDVGTTITLDNPIHISNLQRYITTDPVSFEIQSSATFSIAYKRQYHIGVASAHGVPTASEWVDQGDSFTVSVTSPTEIVEGDQQWVCTGFSVDGGSVSSGPSYTFVDVQGAHTIVFNWKKQFWIQVNSAYGGPSLSEWVDQGDSFTVSVTSPTEIIEGTSQLICTGFRIDNGNQVAETSFTFEGVDAAHKIDFSWKNQFYLLVNSAYGSHSDSGWHDANTTATAELMESTFSEENGVQYVFTEWADDAYGSGLTSNPIVMNQAKIATANWKIQYYLTTYSDYGPISGAGWYDSGDKAFAEISESIVTETEATRHTFVSWSGDASGTATRSEAILMNSPRIVTASWKTQYYLAVSTNFGEVNSSNGWYDAGSSVDISAVTPETVEGERYLWNGWIGTGSGNYAGTENPVQVTMLGPITEVASWTQQYMLKVSSQYGNPNPSNEWFNAGTRITASVDSPVEDSFLTRHECIGWTGSGSVPLTGATTDFQFVIDKPSSLMWKWETQLLYMRLMAIVAVLSVSLMLIPVYLLLRRRHNRSVKSLS